MNLIWTEWNTGIRLHWMYRRIFMAGMFDWTLWSEIVINIIDSRVTAPLFFPWHSSTWQLASKQKQGQIPTAFPMFGDVCMMYLNLPQMRNRTIEAFRPEIAHNYPPGPKLWEFMGRPWTPGEQVHMINKYRRFCWPNKVNVQLLRIVVGALAELGCGLCFLAGAALPHAIQQHRFQFRKLMTRYNEPQHVTTPKEMVTGKWIIFPYELMCPPGLDHSEVPLVVSGLSYRINDRATPCMKPWNECKTL